jgi:hypothetical protein
MFFARQRVLARQHGLAATKLRGGFLDPRNVDEFLCHMQAAARGMLRKPS